MAKTAADLTRQAFKNNYFRFCDPIPFAMQLLRVAFLPLILSLTAALFLPAVPANASYYACAADHGCVEAVTQSVGDRVPNLKFNATTSYQVPNLLLPSPGASVNTTTTALKLQFDLVDSKVNETFVCVTYSIVITRIESDDDNGNGSKIVLHGLFQSADGPLVLDIEQGTYPYVTTINATKDPFLGAWIASRDSNYTIPIKNSELLKEGSYKADVQILSIDFPRNIVDYYQIPPYHVKWTVSKDGIASTSGNGSGQEQGWKTYYMVGKFLYHRPPKPDQLFKFYYRVINGTIENFTGMPHEALPGSGTSPLWLIAYVSSMNSSHNNVSVGNGGDGGGGLLQIKYPRNYPFLGSDKDLSKVDESQFGNYKFSIHVQEQGGSEKPITPIPPVQTTADCFYNFSIPFNGTKTKIVVGAPYFPEPFPFQGKHIPDSCIHDTVVGSSIPPFQQLKAGLAAKDIVCREGLQLIVQPITGKPYCATHATAIKLSQWWHIPTSAG